MSNQVPRTVELLQRIQQCRPLLGVATVEMPDIEYMTETAFLAPESLVGMESSTLGHLRRCLQP